MIPYREGYIIGVPEKSPLSQNPVIFLNTYTGVGATRNTWTTVDLSEIVPSGTKSVCLDGILIITHGTSSETADLMVHFRKPSETYEYGYIMQTVETAVGSGQRSNASVWVSLDENRCFQYKWNTQYPVNSYPSYSSYGLNLTLTAYIRGDISDISTMQTKIATLESEVLALQNKTYNEDPRVQEIIDLIKTL